MLRAEWYLLVVSPRDTGGRPRECSLHDGRRALPRSWAAPHPRSSENRHKAEAASWSTRRGCSRQSTIAHVVIVGLGVAVDSLTHTTTDTSLHEQEHVNVSEQLQLDLGELEHGVPSESGGGVVVRWAETVRLQTIVTVVLKDVGEK